MSHVDGQPPLFAYHTAKSGCCFICVGVFVLVLGKSGAKWRDICTSAAFFNCLLSHSGGKKKHEGHIKLSVYEEDCSIVSQRGWGGGLCLSWHFPHLYRQVVGAGWTSLAQIRLHMGVQHIRTRNKPESDRWKWSRRWRQMLLLPASHSLSLSPSFSLSHCYNVQWAASVAHPSSTLVVYHTNSSGQTSPLFLSPSLSNTCMRAPFPFIRLSLCLGHADTHRCFLSAGRWT